MVESIDFNKVLQYSRNNCVKESKHLCATYVKKAFEAGGCVYVSGNGWDNQNFCTTNGFKCIGDFVPIDNNPRPHNGLPLQFPQGYVQQLGDICLIKHGQYGHICYATGSGINDWVSDFWQRYPGQMNGMGPYCYVNGVERVQFWRHSSVMSGAPEVTPISSPIMPDIMISGNYASSVNTPSPSVPNTIGAGTTNVINFSGTLLGTHIRQK